MASTKIPQSPGPSPRKRVKLEEKPAANQEIAAARKLILDEHYLQMKELKESYMEHLTECFYLQSGQNLMDFLPWKRRPTPQLMEFLKSGRLDSDDEEESPLVYLQEKDGNKEMKTLTSNGSSASVGTSVAASTTLSVTPAQATSIGRIASQMTSLSTTAAQFHRSVSDTKLITMTHSTKTTVSASQSGTIKRTPPGSPGRYKQNSGSFENITGVTTQEAIVERAKQEAQVMSRVSELRKEGLWSSRRLPKVQEPARNKAHWDYLLEEMQWLAADFAQERKWKKAAARKIARMVQKHFQDLEQKEIRAEKEEGMRVKRIAGQMAKMVREFWGNIEKVVQYKQQSRLDEKRKKALDLHLNFIVDQTEKYSTWLTEGLKTSSKGSLNTTPDSSIAGDDEFKPEESESDDEETIAKDEAAIDESETKDEIAALQKESEVPLDQLLESLPKEILEKPAPISSEKDETEKTEDEEFAADEEEEIDVEETIEEQEKHEKKQDVKQELDDLKNEGDMDLEELRAKYAAAYDSDFEIPQESEEETTEYEDSSDDEEEESEDEEEEEEVDVEGEEDVGLEALVHSAETAGEAKTEPEEEEGPGKQLTDIAAEAASLQPKGYTLQTTEVKTKVPFLLKHTLREYQHVGLDWLATMFEKRLNGILADEMGLGKTIQTIALLAHLACEKGIWGPHLIVVPTSVMLNWEMEFKKWCPAFKILTYYGTQKERKQKRMGWTKTNAFHICITSYKLVIQDHQSFRRKKWKYLILDEAQNIKNFKSQRWQTLLNFNSLRRLLLTGTPLQNSLMELWSLMHFLMPQVFQSHREFKEWFANPLTGMIEGSHEYNEKLIHRLHKVLRPFLLRRLKDDVEKQMPKKYEHIVMCHLAKRQRFLYDEFMAQGKTKETLASGHFMSVINILMQLRKVCNHPSLFDPRPIVSPFQMEGLVYNTASMVLNALKYDPLEDIDIRARFPSLADMEKDLPAFVAHRVRKLQTSRHLIEEIDSQPPPPPRLPVGKLKHGAIRCVSPGIPSGRASPQVLSRSVSPAPFGHASSEAGAVTGTSQPPLQAKVLPQNALSSGTATTTSTTSTSQAITVQIQRTDQGTRFVVPSGFLQIVQTSTGQHLIATSSAASTVAPLASASSTVVNGEPVVTMATSLVKTTVSSTMSQVKMSPLQQTSSSSTVRLPESSAVHDSNKPVMRVSPLTETVNGHLAHDGAIFTTASTSVTTTVPVTSTRTTKSVKHTEDLRKLRKQEFFMESLYVKRRSRRKEHLDYLVETNRKHCDCKPVYGHDFCDSVNIFKDPYNSKTYTKRDRTLWNGPGAIHCYCAKFCRTPDHPNYLWNQTKVLSDVIRTPEQYLHEQEEVLNRFVFAIPPVQCPPLRMHVSHPTPAYIQEERQREHLIHTELSPLAASYHKISTKMTVQFPELRLIQYDCGKLQTLDILLRRLKTGDHRVLIFTQMTKMLNILESFLSYHGHRYLRLDGTTKVEQRQQMMDRFNADKRIFCFILSTRSGGIGVNLTGADTVIFYDSDWNPTMDAQAQDRCHRIGQTRDVHIYRLISERTVEENILKKANQKRMLGDMAIEGGNFTTTFFKEQTINELFSEPSGLDSLVKEKEEEEREKQEKQEKAEQENKDVKERGKKDVKVEKEKTEEEIEKKTIDSKAMLQFEKALAKTEDETDVIAAEKVKAEQKAELVEFDENVPWDEQEAVNKGNQDSTVEKELAMLDKELSPIERYAVLFAELQLEPVNAEELMIAEEDIANAKKDWELNRLKALKEEEERRLEFEEDEMLYTYSRDDAYQQVFLSDIDNEEMPLWAPPTPPHDENDVYIDKTVHFLYEPTIMPETQLPPVYIKKEKKKIKVESITTRTQKQKRQEQPRVPRSLFDRPTAQLLKLRRDAKIQKLKQGQLKLYRPMPSMPAKPIMEAAPDHPEWLIHEDWALLQAVQSLFDVPLNLMIVSPAHTPNWDMVADVVNSCSRVYRSPKQCRLRYENVIIPREEGRILYDMNPRKQKKTKGIYKMTTKNNRPMKTSQIHGQDSNNGVTLLYSLRFDSVKGIATKRPPTMRQTLVNPTQKNPKHASVLQENSISYDHPLNPMQVAEIRAQRIQREKKQNQQQQQQAAAAAAQAQSTDQTAVTAAATVTQRPQIATITPPQVSTATLVAVTSGVTASQLATIGTVSSTATVLTVTGVPPIQTAVRTKTPIQEISSGITASVPVATSQVRAQLQTGTTTVTTGLTQVQLAQRISAATTLASGATVQQQLQAAGKTLTPQQYQLLRSQTMLSQQKQQQALQQQQLRTMQRLTLVSPDQLKQQQLRQLKGSVIQGGQKTVIAQQLVTSMPQPVKQGQLKTTPVTTLTRPLTTEELTRLKQQQLAQQQKLGQVPAGQQVAGTSVAQIQHHAQPGQLQTTQIIAAQAPVQQVGQTLGTVSGSQAATLVKTVSAPAGSVTIPVNNMNISVSMQQKGGLAKINPQQMKQMQLLQQRKPQTSIPVQKGIAGQKVGAPQMLNAVQIIQQQSGARSLTVQQLHQLMKQQPQGTIQQIIHTSQPTIIATVTQSQQQPHMVTKVVNTTIATTAAIQTITASASSSAANTTTPVISLSQVPIPSLNVASVGAGQSSVTASIVKPAGGTEGVTTVQIHPVSSLTQSKLVVPQNVVVQPIQQISGTTTGQTHVIPAQSLSQHVTLSGTPQGPVHVTVPAPSQVQHVTVATPTQIQQAAIAHTQQSQVNVTVVSHPSTPTPNPGPMTVTVTPAPVTPSPVQTPTPVHTPVQASANVSFASPSQTITLTPTSMSTQPVAVTDQTVQQTVAAVLQPRQQTQASAQPVTTHTQASTHGVAQPQGQPQAQPLAPPQQATGQSPQPSGKPAPYAMRTRKQSERQ